MGKVLFATLNWGLGHATRSMPIIDVLLKHGNSVDIIASGMAYNSLNKEFPDLSYYQYFDDYPLPFTDNGFSSSLFWKTFPSLIRSINNEKKKLDNILLKNKYDLIISDERFGIYSHNIPSFLLCHEFRWDFAGFFRPLEKLTELFNSLCHRNFEAIIVPDNPPDINCLGGKLSRSKPSNKVYYAGILCSINKLDCIQDIDYLFMFSGPDIQKRALKDIILHQIGSINGRKVVLLGSPSIDTQYNLDKDTLIKSYSNRKETADLMNRANFIISRSGYTTMMELAELQKKNVLLIPTPNQSEQEYLAKYYQEKGWFYSVQQNKLNLANDIEIAKSYSGLPFTSRSADNSQKLYADLLKIHL